MIFSIYHPETISDLMSLSLYISTIYSYLVHFFGIPQLEKVQKYGDFSPGRKWATPRRQTMRIRCAAVRSPHKLGYVGYGPPIFSGELYPLSELWNIWNCKTVSIVHSDFFFFNDFRMGRRFWAFFFWGHRHLKSSGKICPTCGPGAQSEA